MKRTRLIELWVSDHSIEFHWDKPEGPYYSGPFETKELAAAYFELRFLRNDKEASHLVPRTYDSKQDKKFWSREAINYRLSYSFEDIQKIFL